MAKAYALWNQQDYKTVTADNIYAKVGRRLGCPQQDEMELRL